MRETNPIIVLVTRGKSESVDYASVHLFNTAREAVDFCNEVKTGRIKYWKEADILRSGEEIELLRPEYED